MDPTGSGSDPPGWDPSGLKKDEESRRDYDSFERHEEVHFFYYRSLIKVEPLVPTHTHNTPHRPYLSLVELSVSRRGPLYLGLSVPTPYVAPLKDCSDSRAK